jgi:uncharacterized protein (TIGR01370 family)
MVVDLARRAKVGLLALTLLASLWGTAHPYELRAPANQFLQSAGRDLRTVHSWHYVLAAADQKKSSDDHTSSREFPIQLVGNEQYPYEMVISMLRPAPALDREHWTDAFLDADNIRTWQNSTPAGNIFLAYIGIGNVSSNHYFEGVPMSARASWTDASGNPTAAAPSWVLCKNGSYAGLNVVAFWHPEWKRRILAEIDHAVTIGANGVYFDEFDGVLFRLETDPGCLLGRVAPVDYRREMLQLVQEIRAYVDAKQLQRRFYVGVFDGRGLYKTHPEFVKYVDAVVGEHMYFVGWRIPGGLNGPEEAWRTAESNAFANAMVAAGRAVFDIEYLTDATKIARLAEIVSRVRVTPAVSEAQLITISKPINLMRCDETQCWNNGQVVASRNLRTPLVAIESDGIAFAAGQWINLRLTAANPAENSPLHLYVGALWPDMNTIAFLTDPHVLGGLGEFNAPATVGAFSTVGPGSAVSSEPVLSFGFPAVGVPIGTYYVFAALFRQGSLADNRSDSGDLVELSFFPITYSP